MTERDETRDRIIHALLPIAALRGWNGASLRAACRAAGKDPALAESHFPTGATGAIAAWSALLDRDMAEAAAREDLAARRIPARIRRLVELRLGLLAPHKTAFRRAMAVLALPWNTPLTLRIAANSADAIWYAAGDTSADFSWYTRRASLAAIHAATLAFWLRDDDQDLEATLAFLDRRLADLARLQRRNRPGLRPVTSG